MGKHFTLVFEGDIRDFDGNPFKTETPFGRPCAVGEGDALAERGELREAIAEVEAAGLEAFEKLKK